MQSVSTISVKDAEENYGGPPLLKPVSPCNPSVSWYSADDIIWAEPPELLPCVELPRKTGKGYFGWKTEEKKKEKVTISLVDRDNMRATRRTGIIVKFRRCRNLRRASQEQEIRRAEKKLNTLKRKFSKLLLRSLAKKSKNALENLRLQRELIDSVKHETDDDWASFKTALSNCSSWQSSSDSGLGLADTKDIKSINVLDAILSSATGMETLDFDSPGGSRAKESTKEYDADGDVLILCESGDEFEDN